MRVVSVNAESSWAPRCSFVFAIAQAASVAELKAEIAREHPELSFAYSRPGLTTFKHKAGVVPPGFRMRSIFARHQGLSLGKCGGPTELAGLLHNAGLEAPTCCHVFYRDAERDGEGGDAAERLRIDAARERLLDALPGRFLTSPVPELGQWVVNVILPPESCAGEPWMIGVHRHEASLSPHPGGVLRKVPPAHAPSRAWSKLEEVAIWADLPIEPGQVAVEIGCAPGGAVVALLDRGLDVVGIDPAAVDPVVPALAERLGRRFRHLPVPVGAVRRSDLPSRVDWLLCDANLAPQVALRYLTLWVTSLRSTLRGVIFTIKINDALVLRALPGLLNQLIALGVGPVRAVQLPSNRREVVAVALAEGR